MISDSVFWFLWKQGKYLNYRKKIFIYECMYFFQIRQYQMLKDHLRLKKIYRNAGKLLLYVMISMSWTTTSECFRISIKAWKINFYSKDFHTWKIIITVKLQIRYKRSYKQKELSLPREAFQLSSWNYYMKVIKIILDNNQTIF